MSIFSRFFSSSRPRDTMVPLYRAIVTHGRDPQWYAQGGVPDTQDGRFDMIAAILSAVLLRLESEGETHASESALLAELFIEDMDGQLRELGIGDIVVGKHIGKMMGALGGRLTAYRDGFGGDGDAHGALRRNLYRGVDPADGEVDYTVNRLRRFIAALADEPAAAVASGALPDLA
ncbi:ubiquinol-cytochrome C chaperone family protein [Parasphingopyxis sp.]|uniref:ubiquinol-cytochrome C chaperone family protein n=1 Tax=Parasphingopyxis sp. TaxID=1920299 RepID=UPI00263575E0|nr:ubiquinol-cytochrome C chaperone family protein [Parasphingopyxis sp.]